MIRINECKRKIMHIKGMTLIEIMIALAIIAILSAIAYPSYMDTVNRSHRVAVLSDMAKIQLEMEEKYTTSYSAIASSIISGGACTFCETQADRYTLSFSNLTATSYTINAVPKNAQVNDKCDGVSYTVITLNQANQGTPNECW